MFCPVFCNRSVFGILLNLFNKFSQTSFLQTSGTSSILTVSPFISALSQRCKFFLINIVTHCGVYTTNKSILPLSIVCSSQLLYKWYSLHCLSLLSLYFEVSIILFGLFLLVQQSNFVELDATSTLYYKSHNSNRTDRFLLTAGDVVVVNRGRAYFCFPMLIWNRDHLEAISKGYDLNLTIPVLHKYFNKLIWCNIRNKQNHLHVH